MCQITSVYSSPCQIHLFDIDVPGKIRLQESETLFTGYELAKFKTGIHLNVAQSFKMVQTSKATLEIQELGGEMHQWDSNMFLFICS